jgi:hypothetical protein
MRERFACNAEFICNELREVRSSRPVEGGIWCGEGFRSGLRQTSEQSHSQRSQSGVGVEKVHFLQNSLNLGDRSELFNTPGYARKPMRDNNILTRFIKPAGPKIGLEWVNWRCLRRSHATWLKIAGADVKDAQAQMMHSRSSTTLDIYQQFVPESQQRAVVKLSGFAPGATTRHHHPTDQDPRCQCFY